MVGVAAALVATAATVPLDVVKYAPFSVCARVDVCVCSDSSMVCTFILSCTNYDFEDLLCVQLWNQFHVE